MVSESFRIWFSENRSELDALVFDIDGVLLVGDAEACGAAELLDGLNREGFVYTLLTNDGSHSPLQKSDFLNSRKIPVRPEVIVSSSHVLPRTVAELGLTGSLFYVMGRLGEPCYAQSAGLRTCRDLACLDKCAGIIMGEQGFDWREGFNAAINFFIRNPQAPLIVPNPDEYYRVENNEIRVGAGGKARFIQRILEVQGTRVEPLFLGKPYQPVFRHNHKVLETLCGRSLEKRKVLMLGDSLMADIPGALEFGYRTGLILTGITSRETLAASALQPEMVFTSL